jgi:hypothetical protein
MKKLPVDENTPKDRWILLFGGKTDEEFYSDKAIDEVASKRPVVGMWDPDYYGDYDEVNGVYEKGAWKICYWDSSWRTYYKNPTHWASLEESE